MLLWVILPSGATNYFSEIEPAVLRRFDHIRLDFPDQSAREAFFQSWVLLPRRWGWGIDMHRVGNHRILYATQTKGMRPVSFGIRYGFLTRVRVSVGFSYADLVKLCTLAEKFARRDLEKKPDFTWEERVRHCVMPEHMVKALEMIRAEQQSQALQVNLVPATASASTH